MSLGNAGAGDKLARGLPRATFNGPDVSQDRWNEIFGADSGPKPNVAPPESEVKKTRKKK